LVNRFGPMFAGDIRRQRVSRMRGLRHWRWHGDERHASPEAVTTVGLRSYRAPMKELGNGEKQEAGRWANNRVKNSPLPF
jgi:putative transposase